MPGRRQPVPDRTPSPADMLAKEIPGVKAGPMIPVKPMIPRDGGDHSKSLDLALAGAMYGCVAVGLVSGVMGVWPLFFAYLPLTVHLALSALLGAALTALVERHLKRPLPAAAIMAVAAALTFAIFAVLPLYLFLHRSIWPAGLLFG